MGNPFDHFGLFIGAVWDHALTLATGCVVTVVISLVEKHWLKKTLPFKADIAILLVFVFFACFQAWQDEYKRADALMHPPSAPAVNVYVPPSPAPQVYLDRPEPTPVKAPTPYISYEVRSPKYMPKVSAPTSIVITAHGIIPHPAFQITCSPSCQLNSAQYMGFGGSMPEEVSSNNTTELKVQFVIPGEMPDGTQCILGVSANSDQELHIKRVKLIPFTSKVAK